MEIKVAYEYTKDWVPPRCRKPRRGSFSDTTTVTIQEVSAVEAPWACVVHGHRRYFDEVPINALRHYNGKFYERAMTDMHIDRKHYAKDSYGNPYWWCDYETERIYQRRGMRVEDVTNELSRLARSLNYAEQDHVVDSLNEWADSYLIVNGELWHKVGEPMYCIYTFGLGHNHGGTSLSVDFSYNDNISHERYFNANDFESAANRFFEIALGRGDTESAHFKAAELASGDLWDYIEVVDPTTFTHNPSLEHGDGDPFMNSIYRMTSGTGSVFESGLLVMAAAANALNE